MYQPGRKKGMLQFSYRPSEPALEVAVAGDFSGWEPLVMRRMSDGTFVRNVSGLPCRCEYKFFVDGRWRHDPDHNRTVKNTYGSLNSVAESC